VWRGFGAGSGACTAAEMLREFGLYRVLWQHFYHFVYFPEHYHFDNAYDKTENGEHRNDVIMIIF
jgi:hypothetical protein